jgi:hypothetical protein
LFTAAAFGATWSGGRTTPNLAEMFAIDATGEPGWLYGAEDLAGDGTTFQQQEKNIDIRTAYAGPEAQALFLRTYVSDTATPGGNVNAYFFIDRDTSTATGTTAAVTVIDPKLTTDPTAGGWDYVVGIKGNSTVLGVWNWTGSQWLKASPDPAGIVVEISTDLDPIKINDATHGYLQVKVPLAAVGLTGACGARFYVRSTNDTAALGAGDLDVGLVGTCDPSDTDANQNGIPDPLEPQGACTSADQCPNDGICQDGTCIFAKPCVNNTDCNADEDCTAEGICRPRPTGTCNSNADCGDLVCENSKCDACTFGATQCGPGKLCAPTGHCITDGSAGSAGAAGAATGGTSGAGGAGGGGGAPTGGTGGSATGGSGGTGGGNGEDSGISVDPGEDVQGGACMCSLPGSRRSHSALLASLAPLIALALRRRRRGA